MPVKGRIIKNIRYSLSKEHFPQRVLFQYLQDLKVGIILHQTTILSIHYTTQVIKYKVQNFSFLLVLASVPYS